jgi:5-formyltetrahydrofolate cyclo-ligase
MENLRPSILKKFKQNNINIFDLTKEEREQKIEEYKNEMKQVRAQKVFEYNKLYYEKNKDTINKRNKEKYKEYYMAHKEQVIGRVKAYQKSKSKPTIDNT